MEMDLASVLQYVRDNPQRAPIMLRNYAMVGDQQEIVAALVAFLESQLLIAMNLQCRSDGKLTREGLGYWVLDHHQDDVADLLTTQNRGMPPSKIVLIKIVRQETAAGLKEAKEGVEFAMERYAAGYRSTADNERFALEEKEAIASIMGSK